MTLCFVFLLCKKGYARAKTSDVLGRLSVCADVSVNENGAGGLGVGG